MVVLVGSRAKRINEQKKDKFGHEQSVKYSKYPQQIGASKKLESNFAAVKIHILCHRRYNWREDDYI